MSRNTKMKLLRCICAYAVLTLIYVSNGQNNSTEYTRTPYEHQGNVTTPESKSEQNSTVEPAGFGNNTKEETEKSFAYDEDNKSNSTEAPTHMITFVDYDYKDHGEVNVTDAAVDVTLTQATTTVLLDSESPEAKSGSSWGYVILVLILLLALALCIILFYMRRVTRTYSFDLQRPAPISTNEPIGTFDLVSLDDFDYHVHTVGSAASDEANGTVLTNEDKEPKGEVEKEEPQTNGLQTLVPSESSPAETTEPDQDQPDRDQDDHTDQSDQEQSPSPILFIEETEEETNANNNNPMVRSSAPFVDINLDEPRHIPTSSSSVQPFSPSIFSSLS